MDAKIFDTLLEPVFILNDKKEIIYCNEPAGLIADLPVRKILRAKMIFDQLFSFNDPVMALADILSNNDASPYQEVGFSNSQARTGKVQLTIQPFLANTSWIVFFRDVTLEETLQKKYRAELEQKEDVIKDLQKARAELEKYSKNLEKMVEERTAEVQKLNKLMTALLNSLEQGFFLFDETGVCLEFASSACQRVIEKDPRGLPIWNVLSLKEKEIAGFQKWMKTIFAEMLPFEDLAPLGPKTYAHSAKNEVKLDYFPIRENEGAIKSIVVVATDITDLVLAQKEAEYERSHVQMILKIVKNRRQILNFIHETESLIRELSAELSIDSSSGRSSSFNFENVFRCLHTIKGGAATFSIKETTTLAHEAESLLTEWKQNPKDSLYRDLQAYSQKIHQSFSKFQDENSEILGNAEKLKSRWIEVSAENLMNFSQKMPESLRLSFQQEFLFEKIGTYFSQFQEVCASLAEREGKLIQPLEFKNADIKINPEVYSNLFNTLIHAYRNAIDHGIENPEQRTSLGKPAEGKIVTEFSIEKKNSSQWLLIQISDDGGGISPEKIRQRLQSKGLLDSHESDEEIIQHVFDSSFSTKESITETSGRGVGMDAILYSAKNLGGHAKVISQTGQGSTLIVEVPWLLEDSQEIQLTRVS